MLGLNLVSLLSILVIHGAKYHLCANNHQAPRIPTGTFQKHQTEHQTLDWSFTSPCVCESLPVRVPNLEALCYHYLLKIMPWTSLVDSSTHLPCHPVSNYYHLSPRPSQHLLDLPWQPLLCNSIGVFQLCDQFCDTPIYIPSVTLLLLCASKTLVYLRRPSINQPLPFYLHPHPLGSTSIPNFLLAPTALLLLLWSES